MAFDPVTLLAMSVAVLPALGAAMLQASRSEQACGLLRWSGTAFLCLGAGFAMVLAAPADIHALLRVLGIAALMLSYGLLWGAARRFDGRPAAFEAVVAGTLVWLLAAALFDPSQAWRIGLTSAIVATYSGATAFEHHRGDATRIPGTLLSRRRATWVFAAHSAFFVLRAILGPTFGLATWRPDTAQLWGAVPIVETVLVAVLVGLLSTAMSRSRAGRHQRREVLDDGLTGLGNQGALLRSGAPLLAASRRAGRPAALLLMELDGFGLVIDRHGGPAGDRLLVAFARLAHDYLPPTSLVCRLGGEEFAAVLPGADAGRARSIAEEIRALFAHVALDGPRGPVHTTVSIGIAHMRPDTAPEGDIAGLLGRAGLCLSTARHGGPDRVVADGDAALGVGPAPRAGRPTAA